MMRYGDVQLNLHNGKWDVSYILEFWHDEADQVVRVYENLEYTVILHRYYAHQELRGGL